MSVFIKNMRWLKILFFIIGLALIYFFITNSDIDNISKQMKRINWRFLFIIGITGFSCLLASFAWKLCINDSGKKVSVFKLFVIRLVGESFAQINPANVLAGDTLKVYKLKKHGITLTDCLSSIAMSRFLIIISGMHLLIVFFIIFFEYFNFLPKNITLISIFVLTILLIYLTFYFFKHKKGILYPICVFTSRFKCGWMVNAHQKVCEVNGALSSFHREERAKYWIAYFLSLLHRFAGALEVYLILYFIKIKISFVECIGFEIGIMIIKSLASFVPGQIGVEEYANKFMLQLANINQPYAWIVVSVIKRARQIFWILLGMISFLILSRLNELKIQDCSNTKNPKEYGNAAAIYNS
ncbi:MAG: flippase-like domain-containing protein [Spirochaetes bacterium]|nr:flippase-like domain-containing protein [Spirochaetota bacterium]